MFDFLGDIFGGDTLSGIGSIVGAIGGLNAAEDTADRANATSAQAEARANAAQERLNKAMNDLSALTPPNLQDYVAPYQRAVALGQLTPEMATAQLVEDTRLAGITIPPALVAAQQNALTKIQAIADQGGLTAIDRAKILDIQDEQSARSRGEQEAIVQNAAQRGVAGSGIEQAARLLSQQAAATRGSRAGTDVAALALQRQDAANTQAAQLAGQMRTQGFNEESTKASAQDLINKYNNQLTNSVNAANVSSRNSAAAANLAEQQRIAEDNLSRDNSRANAQGTAAQQNYLNQFNKGTALTNAATGQATTAQNASTAANTLADKQLANSDAQRAAAIGQATTGVGSLIDLWKKKSTDTP